MMVCSRWLMGRVSRSSTSRPCRTSFTFRARWNIYVRSYFITHWNMASRRNTSNDKMISNMYNNIILGTTNPTWMNWIGRRWCRRCWVSNPDGWPRSVVSYKPFNRCWVVVNQIYCTTLYVVWRDWCRYDPTLRSRIPSSCGTSRTASWWSWWLSYATTSVCTRGSRIQVRWSSCCSASSRWPSPTRSLLSSRMSRDAWRSMMCFIIKFGCWSIPTHLIHSFPSRLSINISSTTWS